jgi:hypothetical protein
MVQIIDSPKSFGESFSQGLAQSLPDALGGLIERKRKEKELAGEDEALEEQGIHVKGIKNPKIRESLLEQHQKGKKKEADAIEDTKRAETIGKYFGKDSAAIYNELTEGGKTKFFESLLDARTRNIDIPQFLGQYMVENFDDFQKGDMPDNQEGQLPGMGNPQMQKPQQQRERDVDEGLSPSERVSRQEKRYEKNLPLYEAEDAKRHGLQAEQETIEILQELDATDKLPKGFGRLNVNYKEGNLLVPALANPEAQRYVKTINQFLNKAKDTFGSRVTNFELDRFLQQLPTLANSREGRAEILKQMKYFNSIEQTYHNELQKYVDEKGGIRNVDWDVAKRKAEERSKPLIAEAKKQFKEADKTAKDLYQKKIDEYKAKIPKGSVLVEKDGKMGYIPKTNLYKATKSGGYKRL